MKYERECPNCGGVIGYKHESGLRKAEINESLCMSCCHMGDKNGRCGMEFKHSEKTKLRISKTLIDRKINVGKKNCQFGKFGKDHTSFGNIHTESAKKKMSEYAKNRPIEHNRKISEKALQRIKDGVGKGKDTLPELECKKILNKLDIEFKHQYRLDNRLFDFYIPSHNCVIEVDGTYGHGKGLEYASMSDGRKKIYNNDKYKNSIVSKFGIGLIRIWDDELNEKTLLERLNEKI